MGEDSRSGEGNAIDGETGGGGSDTTILLHVSADRSEAYGVSLPRDAMVARPECSTDDTSDTDADPDRRHRAGRRPRHVQHRVRPRRAAVHRA